VDNLPRPLKTARRDVKTPILKEETISGALKTGLMQYIKSFSGMIVLNEM
jgi:hypothetical protein